MAVAAAIGVGEDQEDVMSNRLANATSRLSGKRSLLRSSNSSGMNSSGLSVQQQQHQHHPHHPQQHQQPQHGLSEINRSIEKMTLQPPQSQSNNSRVVTTGDISTALLSSKNGGGGKTSRRDSDWTSVSTEDPGYGSMRSDHNTSRRCSELSTASQVSIHSTTIIFWYLGIYVYDLANKYEITNENLSFNIKVLCFCFRCQMCPHEQWSIPQPGPNLLGLVPILVDLLLWVPFHNTNNSSHSTISSSSNNNNNYREPVLANI